MAEILRLNAIIQTENMKGNMFVFLILRTWQNIFEVFQLVKNVRIIVHKKEELELCPHPWIRELRSPTKVVLLTLHLCAFTQATLC